MLVNVKIKLTFLNETDLKIMPGLVSLSIFYVCFWRIFSLHAVLDGGFWRINLELKKKSFRGEGGEFIFHILFFIYNANKWFQAHFYSYCYHSIRDAWDWLSPLKKRDSYPANFGVKIQIVILGRFLTNCHFRFLARKFDLKVDKS